MREKIALAGAQPVDKDKSVPALRKSFAWLGLVCVALWRFLRSYAPGAASASSAAAAATPA